GQRRDRFEGAEVVRLGGGDVRGGRHARLAAVAAGPAGPRASRTSGPVRWLRVRRPRGRRDERAYYLGRGPADTPWKELVRVAGSRWTVGECFERAKGDCGLSDYEVRSWVGWYRHVTLSMFALAMLAVIRSRV